MNKKDINKPVLKNGKKPKSKGKKKRHLALKITAATVLSGVCLFFAVNAIKTHIDNNTPPIKNPHDNAGDIFDSNGNDFEFDKNGQIVIDKMTDAEKAEILNKYNDRLLKDSGLQSQNLDILSISLLPCNLNEETNKNDKYRISFLLRDEKKDIYALDYASGVEFSDNSQLTADFLFAFLDYLYKDCAPLACNQMGQMNKDIKDLIDEDIIFLGDAYLGNNKIGDDYYYIPAYKKDGNGKVFACMANDIDMYGLDPMAVLHDEIKEGNLQKFNIEDFAASTSLQKIFKLYNETLKEKSEENQTN